MADQSVKAEVSESVTPSISRCLKTCTGCKEEKPIEEFYRFGGRGRRPKCKTCEAPSRREYHLKTTYGIEWDEYEALLEKQGGVCAICRRDCRDSAKGVLCVDHDHDTGEIRGLLCSQCNAGLGNLSDNPEVIYAAASYLEKFLW